MRIAYIVPERIYQHFAEIIPHIEQQGHELVVNPHSFRGFDLIWCAMLPQTPEWRERLYEAPLPMVIQHWDQFSFVDYEHSNGWRLLFDLLPSALDIWSASYDTAGLLKASHELESWVMGSWVNPEDFQPPFARGDYVLYAAPSTAFHKRLDWAELACNRLGVPFRSTYQGRHGLTRANYCELMKNCRCYVMCGFEESNATIPALEAALSCKPVILSDLPACREEFGDTATYFKPWDFGDLKAKLADVCAGKHPPVELARQRVLRLFDVVNVAKRIAGRLKELESRL